MSAASAKSKGRPGDRARRAAAKLRKLRAHARAQVEDYLRHAGFGEPSELRAGGSYRLETDEVSGFAEVEAADNDVY